MQHIRRQGRRAGSGSGRQTVAVGRPPQDPLAFAHERSKEYETTSETDAGKLKRVTGAGGTISFWLQPAWDAMSQDAASFVRIGDDRIRVYKSAAHLRFESLTGATDRGLRSRTDPGEWPTCDHLGRPQRPARQLILRRRHYVGQSQYHGQIELPRKPKLSVGTNAADQPVAPGLIADVKVHNRPLNLEAVSRWFEESRPPGQ